MGGYISGSTFKGQFDNIKIIKAFAAIHFMGIFLQLYSCIDIHRRIFITVLFFHSKNHKHIDIHSWEVAIVNMAIEWNAIQPRKQSRLISVCRYRKLYKH